jgi:DNA polymerase V
MGLFNISEDHLESYQSLDKRFIRNKASTYFFVASGEAMAPLILDKDVLFVDRSLSPRHNHIVVVTLDNELLCRRLVVSPQKVVLRAENPLNPEIHLLPEDPLQVFGVVIGLGRDFYGK